MPQFFGEVSLLQGIKRTTSAKAQTPCILFQIKKPELLSVLEDFPKVEKFLNSVASSRRRRVHHFVRPIDNPISEEDNYDSEDRRTEVFLQSKDKTAAGKVKTPDPNVAE
jgi:CRP-like cAMP-binding protein